MVVLAVNSYTYTSLSYITLDILKRLLNEDFSRAFISVPLQQIGETIYTPHFTLALTALLYISTNK